MQALNFIITLYLIILGEKDDLKNLKFIIRENWITT